MSQCEIDLKPCKRAFTIVEILVTVLIIGLIAVPLFQTLVAGKKMRVSSERKMTAVNLASSWMSAVSGVNRSRLMPVAETEDLALTGGLSLLALGLVPAPDEYKRFVTIEDLPSTSGEKPVFYVLVSVRWLNKESGDELSYELHRLVGSN